MHSKKNFPPSPAAYTGPGIEIAFDVGHSSIGWAVLQAPGREPAPPNLLGCGAVTFGADDCLASQRRAKRRERRHTRATRQRIARIEALLWRLGVLSKTELDRQHAPAKGHSKENPHSRRGFSTPWLLAARVLAARNEEEKKQARIENWSEMWDVLRWYAHNRGYDGNIRWSGGFRVDAFAATPQLKLGDFEEQTQAARNTDQGADEDWKKLEAATERMGDYGFVTPTFAETVAKFLLGPKRHVSADAAGKPGVVQPSKETFSEEQFRRLLFHCGPVFEKHPPHLCNYFKGLHAAFPRRIIKTMEGKRTLVGGTEWEIRYILRQHFGILPGCDAEFERAICGGIPEGKSDWRAYESRFRDLYLSDEEEAALEKVRVPRTAPKPNAFRK